ncbi:SDR family oxidoreductase [Chryseobacterium gossypii]|uniref:SDR family oxidoreductase n=1 Tax=Chryseobacterium gossypii TaxID=3231602 RepID=UPI003F98351E
MYEYKIPKTIVITGASRGIGAATAILAGKKGYNVVVNYLKNRDAAETVADEIRRAGGKAIVVKADVSEEKDVKRLFAAAVDAFGKVDMLVNNAGILEKQSRLADISADRWQRIFQANVLSCFLCCREAIKLMSGNNGGSIVNVSSVASQTGSPNEYVDYAASKGAVDSLTIGLAKEVAAENIRVNGVRPGFIYTDIHSDGGEPDRVERLKNTIPMLRGGSPEEVAHSILWLLSDEASFCTGTFINVTGGK